MANVVIIDGNSIINKAYYGIRGMTNSAGFPTNAVFGFMKIFRKILEDIEPGYVAVCFDLKGGTFRNELYPEYKANRKSMDIELAMQLDVVKQILRAMGYRIVEKQGFEADDLIGTLAYSFSNLAHQVYILTGDRDSLQLVGENRFVCYHGGKDKVVYDAEKVKEDMGVAPDRIIDLKGLMGDSSDNIPGIKGVGKVTALKLLNEFGSLEAILDGVEKIGSARTRKLVEAGRDMALLSKKLASIDCAVDLAFDVESFVQAEADEETLQQLFVKYELKMLEAERKARAASLKDRRFAYREAVRFRGLEDLSDYDFSQPIFADLIKDDDLPLSKDFDYLLLYQSGKLPVFFDAEAGDSLFAKLGEESRNRPLRLKGGRLKDFMLLLRANGIDEYEVLFDLSVVDYLLDPNRNDNDISFLTGKYLQLDIPPLVEIYDKGKKTKSARTLNPEELAKCLAMRMQAAERLEPLMMQGLERAGLSPIYEEIERPLSHVLVDMQVAGFPIDLAELERIDRELGDILAEIEDSIYLMAGRPFNINSPSQLATVLFEELGLKAPKKTKTGYSTSKEVLDKLKKEHPIVNAVLEYRMHSKLKSTYTEGLRHNILPQTGAIHSYLEQTVAATGRISSHNPNLQNIPIRYEMGRELRKAFVPRGEDYLLLSADYSQIELRILAHLSGDETMISAYRQGIDIHALTASQMFGKELDEVTTAERSDAKAVNFGIIYGMGKFSLSEDLKVSIYEAEQYIFNYFAKYPKVKAFLDRSKETAKERGYAETLFGRKRPIPELKSQNFNVREYGNRIAMNAPIQGTSADIIKIAMIRVNEGLKARNLRSRLIMQIHDELIIDTHREEYEEVKALLVESMENACELAVPLVVAVSEGKTWYEAK